MPPKKKVAAPIDKPLSRAYLREFTGWSTAYPPGISDPTSLRIMENVQIQRDGSCRIRPGLRYLSILAPPVDDETHGTPIDQQVVGSHEPFFLEDGSKAYLFAVREDDDTVGFRVLANTGLGYVVQELDALGIAFSIPQGEATLNFSEATTYVKYLQIDNKIFALSNAGETMRLFTVGTAKTAKRLSAIRRPEWTPFDKLTVVHPSKDWIDSGVPLGVRTNLVTNPSWETNANGWTQSARALTTRSTDHAGAGGNYSLKIESGPTRTNLMPVPLRAPVSNWPGWTSGAGTPTLAIGSASWLQANCAAANQRYYVNAPKVSVTPGEYYRVAFDAQRGDSVTNMGVLYRFFASNGAMISEHDTYGTFLVSGRVNVATVPAPAQAATMQAYIYITNQTGAINYFRIRNVVVCRYAEPGTYFDGSSGTDYFWTGAADASPSVHHDPAAVSIFTATMAVVAGLDYAGSIYVRAASTAREWRARIQWLNGVGSLISTTNGSAADDTNSAFTRYSAIGEAPAGATRARLVLESTEALPRGEAHYADQALYEQDDALGDYFVGSSTNTSTLTYAWLGEPHNSASTETELSAPATVPVAATPTADTLVSNSATANTYNFGFFYTFANEVGESAASQVTVVKARRGWSQWRWEAPDTDAEPNGTPVTDPADAADQLVAYMQSGVFNDALAQGATKWHLYMATWSDQDPAPVVAIKIATRDLTEDATHGQYGWARATPQQADISAEVVAMPNERTRYNYSDPSRGGQGIVAADRMVMVYDPTAPAVIRWSSSEQGFYTDFSAHKGGGYKTLTSGNLYVPAVVKLWQNPQSVDTLTILCLGVDGLITGYYMAPSQVASQAEAVNIMGFEETTATPGTTSPYGVEVLNNALYHPLDDQLMKSTATNYNINHSSLTDHVQDGWRALQHKERIVSSQLDNRIYYLVQNPNGAPLEDGCWGNEVWVYDAAQKTGTWSRWLTQGHSLRKFEQGGKTVMSLIRPDGIYYFDEDYSSDDYVADGEVLSRAIPWRLETNTQGANRAHDAWAHLQQANVVLGNFHGQLRYGVRGHDVHGKTQVKSKVTHVELPPGELAWDREDFLSVQRTLREWFFFAESVEDEEGVVLPSAGQINLVQYRYLPSTVNTGYEFGSVETFEYGRAANPVDSRTTDNGVPMPYIDTGRP